MPSVTLTILGDASGARRAIAETQAAAERATAVLGGDRRRSSAEQRRGEAEEIQGARRQLRVLNDARVRDRMGRKRADDAAASQRKRDRRREENEEIQGTRRQLKALTTARQKAARDQKKIGDDAVRDANRAEQRKTQNAEREEKRRTRLAETEVRRRQRTEEALERRVQGRQFRQAIGQQRRGEAQSERDRTGRYRAAGGVINAVGGAAVGVATDIHGQIQDARRRRAMADRALGNTMRNAGMSGGEATSTRSASLAFSLRTGMEYSTVVDALQRGQERGSALEAGPGRTRAMALQEAFGTIRDANAEGVNPGQLLAARGRLRAAGLSGAALDTAQRFTIGAAQRGSVEVDQIIQQGLPGATQLMSQRVAALGAGASPEAQQAARLRAFQESVSLQEVAARSGRTAGNTANTLSSLQNFLSQPRRQEMMLNNIRQAEQQVNTRTPEGRAQAERFRALRTEMFERDDTRTGNAMRMRSTFVQSPLDVAARLAAATNGNASQATNILAGGGHSNPQSFLSNQRQLFSFLGTEGQSVRDMMNGGGVSGAQLATHRQAVEGDDLSKLNRDEQSRDTALLDNTGALRQLSDRFASWSAQSPIGSSVLSAGSGLVGGLLSGGRIGGAMQWLRGGGVSSLLTRGATVARAGMALANTSSIGTAINSAGAATGAAGVGSTVAGVLAAGAGGLAAGYGVNRALGHNEDYANPFNAAFYTEFGRSVRDSIRDGMAAAHITATVDPHTAAHAASQAAGSRGGPAR